jgi:predicted nucleic acid-binding protein
VRAYIDTSAMVKKYVDERGSDIFLELLTNIQEIIVGPTYILELSSAVKRKLQQQEISRSQADGLLVEAKKDLSFFSRVNWNENLEEESVRLIAQYGLKTLDSIQLGSAILAKPDIFITSDKFLLKSAREELRETRMV